MTMYVHTKFQNNRSSGLGPCSAHKKRYPAAVDAAAAAADADRRPSQNHSIRWIQYFSYQVWEESVQWFRRRSRLKKYAN